MLALGVLVIGYILINSGTFNVDHLFSGSTPQPTSNCMCQDASTINLCNFQLGERICVSGRTHNQIAFCNIAYCKFLLVNTDFGVESYSAYPELRPDMYIDISGIVGSCGGGCRELIVDDAGYIKACPTAP